MTRERTTIKADRGACGWRRPTGAATYSRSGARRAKWRTKQRSKGRAYASIFGLWRRRGASGGPGRPRALPLGLPDTLAAMNPHGGAERHKKRRPRLGPKPAWATRPPTERFATMKRLLFAALALGLLTSVASAQQAIGPGRTRGDTYFSGGCGSSWEICAQRRAARSNPKVAQANSPVPKFCYSLKTGKFTHWGPCRRVVLPNGQVVKVAH
jgi:hypothetical protein